ncbi:hypothetical protein EXS74_02290 [Candidatus Woesearchaeota archaeon]|nr:hypothetical protein [Candidatus Woesearchaeota archaeon]
MKGIILFIFLISIPFVLAHAGESHEETAGGKIVEIGFLPSEPVAERASIIYFEVNDETEKSVTHIDGLMDITKDGEILVDDYKLHSHGNQFSMTYKFPEDGQYTLTLTVFPAEGYDNEKFDPISVIFYVTAEEDSSSGGNTTLLLLGIVFAAGIVGVLLFTLKQKSKTKHSGTQHLHQQE